MFFFSQTNVALDMLEINTDKKIRLIQEIKLTDSYDYIILDMDFGLSKDFTNIYRLSQNIVFVGDGSECSNMKIFRAYNALCNMEDGSEETIANRIMLMYNKFSNKTSKAITGVNIRDIGGAPRYEHATVAQVLEHLSQLGEFDKIIV